MRVDVKINFLNEYYQNRASDQNASYLLNMYLEEDKANGKYQVVAYPRAGTAAFNADSGSVVRGSIEHAGVYYAVVDNTFNSYNSGGTKTLVGTLNTSTGIVRFAAISNQIILIDGTNGYHYNTSTLAFTTISDADFPTAPHGITAQNSTFLVSQQNTATIYGSDVSDGTSWATLSFLAKDGFGDRVNGLISNKSLIYVFGEYDSDIWYNSGDATFSFAPIGAGGVFNYGCAAINSIAKGQDKVVFLAQSRRGGYEVCVLQQYTPQVISNRAINYQMSLLTTPSDAIGFCYNKSGHEFYVLTFPTDAKTFVCDLTTGLWSEYTSYISAAYTRFIANCHSFCYGKNIIGAYNAGALYSLSDTSYQDNGQQIKRQVITPPGYSDGDKTICDELQIDLQTNVGSSLTSTLEVSKDSGQTYATSYTLTTPSTGGRNSLRRLGLTQTAFVFRLSTTMNANFIVLGATADIRKSNN